ncbi:MAG: ABC transporter ATP-binding protein [Luminiphilus sp.]|nr:ABC transporter ATP-binding protein [Luminiphilus sp.]
MAKITLSNLAHRYAPLGSQASSYALTEINHVWQDGGAYALLGPSGCGKTTLLNIISGLIKPSQGRVLFDDNDVTGVPTEQRDIAQVFQFPVVYDTMTVRENLAFPLKNRGMAKPDIQARVALIAEMIGLEELLDSKARRLSPDAKQKISLGRGMVRESVNAILFDEPLTVIDPHLKWELRTQLKALHREFGHTMIYVTHDQTEAMTFADKVVMLHEGRIVQIGTPEDLFEQPEHTFVGHFIGSPGMNLLDASIHGDLAMLGERAVPLASAYGTVAGRTQIGIRPEHIRVMADGGLPAEIRAVENVGHRRIVRAHLDGHSLNIVLPPGEPLGTGTLHLQFPPDKINVYADEWRVAGSIR